MAAKKRASKKRVTKKRTVKKKTARRAPPRKKAAVKKRAPARKKANARKRNPGFKNGYMLGLKPSLMGMRDEGLKEIKAYWTGATWDTDPGKAVIYPTLDGVKKELSHLPGDKLPGINYVTFAEPVSYSLGKTDAPRKRNPAARDKYVNQAMELFEDFRGENPESVERINLPIAKAGLTIGPCDGIMYTTRRDGKVERYIHRFKKSARPLLVSSFDGKQLYIVGGQYTFTDRGIVDK